MEPNPNIHRAMNLRFVFACDAEFSNGAGHIMRSLSIAEELQDRGYEIIFLGPIDLPNWVLKELSKFEVVTNDNYLLAGFDSDPARDFLVLDSYTRTIDDVSAASTKYLGVAALVDEITPQYPADIYFSLNLIESRKFKKSYFGPKYIPIRRAILEAKSTETSLQDVFKVLVTGGGTDPYNFVPYAIEQISKISGEFKVVVITDKIREFNDSRFEFCETGSSIIEIIRTADLAISPASTSSYEFLACGIPLGLFCVTDNQIENFKALTNLGYGAPLGRRNYDNSWDINTKILTNLLTDRKYIAELRQSQGNFLFTDGARNIVDLLLNLISNRMAGIE